MGRGRKKTGTGAVTAPAALNTNVFTILPEPKPTQAYGTDGLVPVNTLSRQLDTALIPRLVNTAQELSINDAIAQQSYQAITELKRQGGQAVPNPERILLEEIGKLYAEETPERSLERARVRASYAANDIIDMLTKGEAATKTGKVHVFEPVDLATARSEVRDLVDAINQIKRLEIDIALSRGAIRVSGDSTGELRPFLELELWQLRNQAARRRALIFRLEERFLTPRKG